MGIRRKAVKIFLVTFAFILLGALNTTAAEETMECYDEYKEMLSTLPDEVTDVLPDELFSDSTADISQGAAKITDFGYVIKVIFEFIGLKLGDILKMLATLMGMLILAALLNTVKSSFSYPGMGDIISLCSSCALFLTVSAAQYNVVVSASEFFTRVSAIANTMIPLMGGLYAMGGNVGSAVASHSSLMIFMNIVENFCAKTVMPVAGICMAFAASGVLAPDMSIGGLSNTFKKMYTNTLTFIMTVFGTVMAAQNLLASKADSLAGKTAKFAMGNLVPVVGSALAGTVGTVSMGIEYIRSSVGIIGVMAVLLLLLPTLITLLLMKLVLSLASGAAEVLGCSREGKMIGELSGINGFLIAAACICSVTLVFMLTLFAKCTSALGGGL